MMLPNVVPLWEVMVAAMKLGAVVIPASTLLPGRGRRGPRRARRGARRRRPVRPGRPLRRRARVRAAHRRRRPPVDGWAPLADADAAAADFAPDGPTRGRRPAAPLLHERYDAPAQARRAHARELPDRPPHRRCTGSACSPATCTSTSPRPGWAKHAWSCVFAPWNAEATVLPLDQPRFHAPGLLDALVRHGVTTLCAPPTVWRMLVQEDLRPTPSGCARSWAPASRSTPRSSSRCGRPGA